MEALTALSLACNVLQLVGLGLKVSRALTDIRKEHEPDASVGSNAIVLRQLAHEIKQSVSTQGSAAADKELCERAREVIEVAHKLETLISRFTTGKKSRWRDSAAYMWKQGDIKAVEKRLQETQRALEGTILKDVWQKASLQRALIEDELPSLKSELRTMIQELQCGNTKIESIIVRQEAAQQMMASIKMDALHIKDDLNKREVAVQQSTEMKEFLRSLYFPSMNERRNMESIVAAKGTFLWILDDSVHTRVNATIPNNLNGVLDDNKDDASEMSLDDETNVVPECRLESATRFRSWLQSPEQNVFWISGKPGSGKSTLMHYLTMELENCIEPGAILLSAFIWTSGDTLQRSMKGLLCTLMYQLLNTDDELARLALGYQKTSTRIGKVTLSDWSETELREALTRSLKSTQRPVYVLIDGLDEIDSGGGGPERLIQLVKSLLVYGNVKMCVSSRPEVFYERSLQHYPHFRLQDLTRDDMRRYAIQQLAGDLSSMPPSENPCHNWGHVLCHIIWKAEGVFLWLELVIRSLKVGIGNRDSWQLMWERIDELPPDLELVYQRMFQRLEQESKRYRDFAATVFALMFLHLHLDTGHRGLGMNYLTKIALYVDKDLRQRVLAGCEEYDSGLVADVRSSAECVRTQILVRCAGLLEVSPVLLTYGWKELVELRPRFIHRTAHDFMMEAGRGLWEGAMPQNLTECLDAQRADTRLRFPLNNYHTGLWDQPHFKIDSRAEVLMEWCNLIPVEFPGNQREAMFQHLAKAMAEEGHWNRDNQNPCVLAMTRCNLIPPDDWLDTWIPTGMTRADFADQLLVHTLSPGRIAWPKHEVRWLCDHGARPYRRGLAQWPGTNWPSAIALAAALSISEFGHPNLPSLLNPMLQQGVDFSERVTVLSRPDCAYAVAVNPCTSTIILPERKGNKKRATHNLFLLQMKIEAFIHFVLDATDTNFDAEHAHLDSVLRPMTTSTSSVSLLGVVQVRDMDLFRPLRTIRARTVNLGAIIGGYSLESKVSFPTDVELMTIAEERLKEFEAEIDAISAGTKTADSWVKLGSEEAIEWALAMGLAEDKRNCLYQNIIHVGSQGAGSEWD